MTRGRGRGRTIWVCQQCGFESPGYYGRCPSCDSWGSMVETFLPGKPSGSQRGTGSTAIRPRPLTEVSSAAETRHQITIGELNRVLGGGLVPGSLVLLGGDPGIGKSTLLLQAADALTTSAGPVLYVAAEESAEQVKLRADRIGVAGHGLFILPETSLDAVLEAAEHLHPAVLVVDSIQTVYVEALESSPGSISQVRECTSRLMQYAKLARVLLESDEAAEVLCDRVDAEVVADLTRLLFRPVDLAEKVKERVLTDCVRLLQAERLRAAQDRVTRELAAAEQAGDVERLRQLQAEVLRLQLAVRRLRAGAAEGASPEGG